MVWPAAYVSCSEDGSAVFAGVGGSAAVGGREGEPHLECRELLGEEGRERRGGHRGGTQLCEDEGERLLGSQLPRVPKGVVLRRRQRRVRERAEIGARENALG